MVKNYFLVIVLSFIFCGDKALVAQEARRVIMIALDGITVDGYKKADTPNIDSLLSDGSFSFATRNVMPSVTLPNWTSILCGSQPEQHGVVDNGWTPNKIKLEAVEKDAKGYYPSLFKVLKDSLPNVKTAFYYNWKELFYPHNADYFDESVYLKDDAYIPYYDKALDFIVANRNDPTCVFLYSVHTDHAGHKYSWTSNEYIASIEDADVQIGIFLNKLKADGLYESSHILFLTDHGGVKYGHGGYSGEEMDVMFGIRGPGVRKGFEITEPNNTTNTASNVLRLFDLKQPLPWTGEVVESMFVHKMCKIFTSESAGNRVYYRIKNRKSGRYLISNNESLSLNTKTEANCGGLWYFESDGDGFLIVGKNGDGKLAKDKKGVEMSQKKKTGWYIVEHPFLKGDYCISLSTNGETNSLLETNNGCLGLKSLSFAELDGFLWNIECDNVPFK